MAVTASNGRAALARCRKLNRSVELAVIDTATADINPLEAEQQLHEMYPRVCMLFLSDNYPESTHESSSSGHLRAVLKEPCRTSGFWEGFLR